MKQTQFEEIFNKQIEASKTVLLRKGKEYSSAEDRLHNFKIAAQLEGIKPRQALAGMMAKHTVSIYDMMTSSGVYVDSVWNEKITDHINYLILLRALIVEEQTIIIEPPIEFNTNKTAVAKDGVVTTPKHYPKD